MKEYHDLIVLPQIFHVRGIGKEFIELVEHPLIHPTRICSSGKVHFLIGVRVREDVLLVRTLDEQWQYIRTAPGKGGATAIENRIKVDWIVLPSFGHCTWILVQAGYHSHMSGT